MFWCLDIVEVPRNGSCFTAVDNFKPKLLCAPVIAVACLEQRFEIVLLHFLADHLLQLLGLEHLIGVLLGAQLDQ
jgi:hypothetical protein